MTVTQTVQAATDLDAADLDATDPDVADAEALPRWSARPYSGGDRDAVLALFAEPDFFYRTAQPDTRPEWEILDLLGEDSHLLIANGALVGLYALEGAGGEHGCHFRLELRLRSGAALSWWLSAYREVVRAVRWRRELVRLTMQIGEFDEPGLRFARSLGLTEEGTLGDITIHEGRRRGYVYFSQIWTPTS